MLYGARLLQEIHFISEQHLIHLLALQNATKGTRARITRQVFIFNGARCCNADIPYSIPRQVRRSLLPSCRSRARRQHPCLGVRFITVCTLTLSVNTRIRRVAIVDYRGQCVYHTYVCSSLHVTEYRTATTGITAAHLSLGTSLHIYVSYTLTDG